MLSRRLLAGLAALLAPLTPLAPDPAVAQAAPSIPEIDGASIGSIETAHVERLIAHTLADNPSIMVLDFPTLEQQGRMFNRVVAMIERQGAPRERVLTDAELGELIRAAGKRTATFAFGNDFRTSELVRFFYLAEASHVELNEDEVLLRRFLEGKGYISHNYGFYSWADPDRVVLSLPQEEGADGPDRVVISAATRNAILRHEVAHGEFYSNDQYAAYCEAFWARVMSDAQRRAFRGFLAAKGYDPGNEALMVNETQAYLIHTPEAGGFSAARVGLPQSEIDQLRQRFWAGHPPSRLFRGAQPGGS